MSHLSELSTLIDISHISCISCLIIVMYYNKCGTLYILYSTLIPVSACTVMNQYFFTVKQLTWFYMAAKSVRYKIQKN